MKEMLEAMYPNQFEFEERRENFDYIYNVEDLLHLKGKKYQAKRNHINQFKKSYNYTYSPLRYEDVDECLAMHEMWKAENDHGLENCLLEQESCAVEIALKIFPYLDLKGGVLRVDNKTVAFTIGQALNDKIFDVQIEKGLKAYHGVYPTINQLFVEHEMQSFQYVNREEDVNDPGLRQSKLSYHPSILLKNLYSKIINYDNLCRQSTKDEVRNIYKSLFPTIRTILSISFSKNIKRKHISLFDNNKAVACFQMLVMISVFRHRLYLPHFAPLLYPLTKQRNYDQTLTAAFLEMQKTMSL